MFHRLYKEGQSVSCIAEQPIFPGETESGTAGFGLQGPTIVPMGHAYIGQQSHACEILGVWGRVTACSLRVPQSATLSTSSESFARRSRIYISDSGETLESTHLPS